MFVTTSKDRIFEGKVLRIPLLKAYPRVSIGFRTERYRLRESQPGYGLYGEKN